jgi:hypothetical protein
VSRRDALVLGALAVVVGVLGFRLGAGDPAGALAAAVGGCPAALLVALAEVRRRTAPGPPELRAVRPLGDTAPAELLRLGAALHEAALHEAALHEAGLRPAHEQGKGRHRSRSDGGGPARALVAAAPGPLPGVSDLDGAVGRGLRGVVSGLRETGGEPVVVAHAVLAGPPAWLADHGVDVPPELADDALLVAWDGTARGALALGADPPRPTPAVRAALLVGAVSAAAGALVAGLLAVPAVVPVAALVAVAALLALPRPRPGAATAG